MNIYCLIHSQWSFLRLSDLSLSSLLRLSLSPGLSTLNSATSKGHSPQHSQELSFFLFLKVLISLHFSSSSAPHCSTLLHSLNLTHCHPLPQEAPRLNNANSKENELVVLQVLGFKIDHCRTAMLSIRRLLGA